MVELLLAAAIALTTTCTQVQVNLGICTSGTIDGGGVTLDGTTTTPGDDGGDDNVDTNVDTNVGIEGGTSGTDPNTVCEQRLDQSYCWTVTPPPEAATSPVTLADIAHFEPVVGTHSMQPDGWVVAGLPANFVSAASTHLLDGMLLGGPASVRFTPVAWHWSYGDGSRASVATGGTLWHPERELSATPTSHVYAHRGMYTAELTVDFRAEYRVAAGGWAPIAGVLAVSAPPLQLTAVGAQTVIVDRDCREHPRGPGCR